MKKIILGLAFSVCALASIAQYPAGSQTIGNDSNVVKARGGFTASTIYVPSFTDTTAANAARYVKSYNGSVIRVGTDFYMRANGGWWKSGGTSAWGGITGTLSAQTDLQNALNLKANLISPVFTGVPTAPTATLVDSTLTIANTNWVKQQLYAAKVAPFTPGSVPFANASGILDQDNTGFSYDGNNLTVGHSGFSNTVGLYINGGRANILASGFGMTLGMNGGTPVDPSKHMKFYNSQYQYAEFSTTGTIGSWRHNYQLFTNFQIRGMSTDSTAPATTGTPKMVITDQLGQFSFAAIPTGGGSANLTGPITSVGSATSITSQTGTGTTFAMNTSPTFVTPNIGAAGALSLTMSGNISASAWTTSGVRLKGIPATFTDLTSIGTVAAAYTDVLGGNTIAATNATTFSTYTTAFFKDPLIGTNVTMTNKYALGSESAAFGTSNQVTVSNAGILTATNSVLASPALTGVPTAPTATAGTTTAQVATTAFVNTAITALPKDTVFVQTNILRVDPTATGKDSISMQPQTQGKFIAATVGTGAQPMGARTLVLNDLPFTLGTNLSYTGSVLNAAGGGSGLLAANFIFNEQFTGSATSTYTLANAPIAGKLSVFKNGMLITDYSLSGAVVTLGSARLTTDIFLNNYIK